MESLESRIKWLSQLSDKELIRVFNREVGNLGWCYARSLHLAAIHKQFILRKFEYSAIGSTDSVSFKKRITIKKKVLIPNSGS